MPTKKKLSTTKNTSKKIKIPKKKKKYRILILAIYILFKWKNLVKIIYLF